MAPLGRERTLSLGALLGVVSGGEGNGNRGTGRTVSVREPEELPECLSFLVFKIMRRVTSALPPPGVKMALEKSSVLFGCQGLLKGAASPLACCWSAPRGCLSDFHTPRLNQELPASRGEGGG